MNTGFLKKELKELIKTPKLLIIGVIFLFFAVIGPLSAKYFNQIIASLAGDGGMSFPEPTFRNAWEQFFNNYTSICMVVYLIIMTGTVINEKNKGNVYLVLTKRVSRYNFVISKMLAATILFTAALIVSALISAMYTSVLFNQVYYKGLIQAIFLVWLSGVFFTVFAVFVSILSKSSTIAALLGFAGYTVFSLFNMAVGLIKFNPIGSAKLTGVTLAGGFFTTDIIINIVSTIVFIAITVFVSLLIFRRQEL